MVVAVGDGVDDGWVGARVVCETYFSTCGACEWCRDGQPEPLPRAALDRLVRRRRLRAAGHRPGDQPPSHPGLARRARCRAARAARVRLPLPARSAEGRRSAIACWSPGRGLSGCSRRRSRGRSAGRCCSSVCRRTSRGSDVARALGFETADEAVQPGSFDVVVECSGSAGGAAACLEAARRRRALRPDRRVRQARHAFPSTGSSRRSSSSPRASPRRRAPGGGRSSSIESRRLELGPLVSEVAPLAAWERVFADLRAGRGVKVVFDPRL